MKSRFGVLGALGLLCHYKQYLDLTVDEIRISCVKSELSTYNSMIHSHSISTLKISPHQNRFARFGKWGSQSSVTATLLS